MRRIGVFSFIFLLLSLVSQADMPKMRNFTFDYDIVIRNITPGVGEIKVWVPCPYQTSYQLIDDLKVDTEWTYSITHERKYNNKVLFFHIKSPKRDSIKINLRYNGTRYEYSSRVKASDGETTSTDELELEKYLTPSRLVTTSPRIEGIASLITKDKKSVIEKARAIYDYVIANVDYDKSTPGWGNGDTERVCDVRKGNCTDFHSLFISLACASNIPARFVIGFPLPEGDEGRISGYHCWAEFYVKGFGWVPIDASEAWKDRTRYEYLFGAIDENRIEFTRGRDIVLEPPQNGEALNYFIYPYAEGDGKVLEDVSVFFRVKKQGS